MKHYEIDFCFKGKRDYVQGPDIYNKINAFLMNDLKIDKIGKINMTTHKLIKNNLSLELYKNEYVERREDTAVVFSFAESSDEYTLILSENNDLIACRYEYREEEITSKCMVNIDKKVVTLNAIPNFSDAEVFTAMNKLLLQSLYPDIDGKWLLTRLQIDRFAEKSEYNHLSIEFKHNFNFKLTKSLIIMDGNEKGFIYFTLLR